MARSLQVRAALVTVAIAVVWVVLAARSPELTYHFAPLLAAVAWPALLRRGGAQALSTAAVAGIGSFVLVTVVATGLHVGDALNGPTFWDSGPALTEAVLFAALGAAFGVRVATRAAPGLLGRLLAE